MTDADIVREALQQLDCVRHGRVDTELYELKLRAVAALDRLVARQAETEDDNERLERKVAVLGDVAAKFNERGELLEDALRDLNQFALRQHSEWMHFHELAMSEPFKAEDAALGFVREVIERLAVGRVGDAETPGGGEEG